MTAIRIGTRRSALALWQANHVADLIRAAFPLRAVELVEFVTQGDKILDKSLPSIGGKGLFTLELENALQAGEIDIAVHSLKDLPTQMPEGFALGAVPQRANPFDALVAREAASLEALPQGAVIGTSSLRRAAQLRAFRADFEIRSIRGNVETRLRKVMVGDYDATILAVAGLERLGKAAVITQRFSDEIMLPAPAQGAIGIQARENDLLDVFEAIDHAPTRYAVTAERAFLNALEAGCSLPVSAHATLDGDRLTLRGRVSGLDGQQTIEQTIGGRATDADALGRTLAEMALAQGADALLQAVNEAGGL